MNFTTNLAYNISDDDFEKIANILRERIVGNETIYFSTGKDNGKDGRSIGFSKFLDNWKSAGSKVIVQSKHTGSPTATCSDRSFFGNKTSIIATEKDKIKKLFDEGELEYYLLFTNRKYSGIADSHIRKYIVEDIGIDINNIEIIGIETINEWLNLPSNKDIVSRFKLEGYQVPFDFSENDIKDVVLSFKAQLADINDELSEKVKEAAYDFSIIPLEEKNKKNQLSKEYYDQVILRNSLPFFHKIEYFLELEKNESIKEVYYDIVNELNDLITLKRDNFGVFEEVFDFIYNKISSNSEYKGRKKYIRFLLHFMYYSCSIGIK